MNTTVKNYNYLFSIQFITRFSKAEDIFLNEHKIQPYETEYDFLPEDEQEFGGLPNSIEIVIAMRVMLIKHIDLSRGLFNGAIGTITNIQLPSNTELKTTNHVLPQTVTVKFDSVKTDASNFESVE